MLDSRRLVVSCLAAAFFGGCSDDSSAPAVEPVDIVIEDSGSPEPDVNQTTEDAEVDLPPEWSPETRSPSTFVECQAPSEHPPETVWQNEAPAAPMLAPVWAETPPFDNASFPIEEVRNLSTPSLLFREDNLREPDAMVFATADAVLEGEPIIASFRAYLGRKEGRFPQAKDRSWRAASYVSSNERG